jgi:hypothetical protein
MEYPEDANASPKTSISALPSELRRMIWLATFEPRMLTVTAFFSKLTGTRNIHPGFYTHHGPWFCTFTAKLGINPRARTQNNLQKGQFPVLSKKA